MVVVEQSFMHRVNAFARAQGLKYFVLTAEGLEYDDTEIPITYYELHSNVFGTLDIGKAPAKPIERLYLSSLVSQGEGEYQFDEAHVGEAADFLAMC